MKLAEKQAEEVALLRSIKEALSTLEELLKTTDAEDAGYPAKALVEQDSWRSQRARRPIRSIVGLAHTPKPLPDKAFRTPRCPMA